MFAVESNTYWGLKTILFAAATVGALALFRPHHTPVAHLTLHAEDAAPVDENHTVTYFTAFHDHELWLDGLDPNHLVPFSITVEGNIETDLTPDCRWGAVETFTPDGPHRYAYSYTEHVVHCDPEILKQRDVTTTPRTGWVSVTE
ncbi:MAG: hypothetical protein QM831_17585 [Kofleriaceae bacterium]